MARRRRNSTLRTVIVLALIGLLIYAVYSFTQDRPADPAVSPSQTTPVPAVHEGATSAGQQQPVASGDAAPTNFTPITAPSSSPEQAAKATEDYRQGLKLLAEMKLVAAREKLSSSLASGQLSANNARLCRTNLTDIAQKVVFSREVYPGDPYARRYVVKGGDLLSKIVKREKLFVPYEGIRNINQIPDANVLRVGQWLKLIEGPFDAIVTKHAYTLDLYHHKMFVKTYRIGLGQNGSTPIGSWIVSDRVSEAQWTPPAGVGPARTIEWGEAGYPLGKDGLWIALRGTDKSTTMLSGFGIHGTNETQSIGREASLGCIRLGDKDIGELFGLLYAGKSKVQVRQ